MAKVGLNFGEKLEIFGKKYRILNDGLIEPSELFGRLEFVNIVGPNVDYTDDLTQPRRADGTYPTIPTGEISGIDVTIYSSIQGVMVVTVTNQSEEVLNSLSLKEYDEIEAKDFVITYSSVRDNQFKVFVDSIVRKGQVNSQPEKSQASKSDDKPGKEQK